MDDYDDWWVGQLSAAGYDSVYVRAHGADHGLVTAFRHDQLQLFRSAEIALDDLCDRITDPNLAARARQNNVALLVCLQPWEKSRLPSAVCVANTQLASSPSLEQVRVLQAEFLCREIATFNSDFHLPIVLAGTFNAVPSSDVYHVVMTGRRRPSPQAPAAPTRPTVTNATPSSVVVSWEMPQELTDMRKDQVPIREELATTPSPVVEFKVGIKNCTSASTGFLHELFVEAPASEAVVATLSAGVTYQFRVAARNENGWSHWSQPSAPVETLQPQKAATAASAAPVKLHITRDTPPQVKPFNASFGSGRTPRYAHDPDTPNTPTGSNNNNLAVCPRAFLSGVGKAALLISGESEGVQGSRRYTTLSARADRDDQLVHGEQMNSAYGEYFEYLCEPELTFSSEKFQGTIDYIFHSTGLLSPFQLLYLPSLDELEHMGQDERQPWSVEDVEWVKHRPADWRDDLAVTSDEGKFMGEWQAPDLPNVMGRAAPWLPNRQCPSDHLPLACVFAMRTENLATMWN